VHMSERIQHFARAFWKRRTCWLEIGLEQSNGNYFRVQDFLCGSTLNTGNMMRELPDFL
jgi:hypothetical protein